MLICIMYFECWQCLNTSQLMIMLKICTCFCIYCYKLWNVCCLISLYTLLYIKPHYMYNEIPVFNSLRPRWNGCHFPEDIFKCIFLNQNVNFFPWGPIDNSSALVQIMAWRRPGDKPLSEPMMVSLLTHICITCPQWVNDMHLLIIIIVGFLFVCFRWKC